MSDEQITAIFDYLEECFDEMDKHFEQQERKHAEIHAALVELTLQVREHHNEMIMLTR